MVRNKAWSSRVVEYGEGGVHCRAVKVGLEWATNLPHHSGSAPKNTTVMHDKMNAAGAEVGKKQGVVDSSGQVW